MMAKSRLKKTRAKTINAPLNDIRNFIPYPPKNHQNVIIVAISTAVKIVGPNHVAS